MRSAAPAGPSARVPARAPQQLRLRHAQRRMRAYPADLDAEPCLGLGASSLSGAQPSSSDEASDLWPDFAGFDPEDSDKLFEGSSDDSMDMTPSVPYLEGLSVCETVVEVAELNRDRVTDRSSIELGATLQAIHRLSPHVSKKDRVPTLVKQLRKDLVREMKRTVKKMPARTIANCIFNMASLKLADKALMSKTVDAIGSRIYRDPTAFKVVELAQITAAFRMMAFKSPKLNENVSTNVMALPRAQLNVRSLINILHDLARMHWRNKAIFSFLATEIMEEIDNISPRMLKVAFTGLALNKKSFDNRRELLTALKEELPKYERGSISALTACNILRDLDDARALDDATARYLTTLFVPEARRGAHGALKFQLPKAAAILDEMGHDTRWYTPPPPPPKARQQVERMDPTYVDGGAPV